MLRPSLDFDEALSLIPGQPHDIERPEAQSAAIHSTGTRPGNACQACAPEEAEWARVRSMNSSLSSTHDFGLSDDELLGTPLKQEPWQISLHEQLARLEASIERMLNRQSDRMTAAINGIIAELNQRPAVARSLTANCEIKRASVQSSAAKRASIGKRTSSPDGTYFQVRTRRLSRKDTSRSGFGEKRATITFETTKTEDTAVLAISHESQSNLEDLQKYDSAELSFHSSAGKRQSTGQKGGKQKRATLDLDEIESPMADSRPSVSQESKASSKRLTVVSSEIRPCTGQESRPGTGQRRTAFHPEAGSYGVKRAMSIFGLGDIAAPKHEDEVAKIKKLQTAVNHDGIGALDKGMGTFHHHPNEQMASTGITGLLARIMDNRRTEIFVSVAIIANAAMIGIQVDLGMRRNENYGKDFFRAFDICFFVVFLLELLMRLFADRPSRFFARSNSKVPWNIFDTFLVLASIVEEILSASIGAGGLDVSTVRVLRVLRLVRLFRVVRVMRFFRDLRVMAAGIVQSLHSLVWALLLLFFIMYLIAVCVLQFAVEEKENQDKGSTHATLNRANFRVLKEHYSSLFSTMYTLYLAITGGVDWREVAEPLLALNSLLGALFIFYVAFAILCVLNIVTGVFVENTNKMTAQDQDLVLMEQLELRRQWFEEVKVLFEAADVDGSGYLNQEEFQEQLQDLRMQAWFRKIGVHVESYSAVGLFQLLDFDGDGQLDLDEFAIALQQVHGAARSIDIAKLSHDVRMLRKDHACLTELCLSCFEQICPHSTIDFQFT